MGFVFIGLIKVDDNPKVIEYNVRMGDPETQVVLPRIKNDLFELLQAIATATLDSIALVLMIALRLRLLLFRGLSRKL